MIFLYLKYIGELNLNRIPIFDLFQGLLFSTPECITAPLDVIRLWVHESQRVYGDKLVDEKDADSFTKFQIDSIKKSFELSHYFKSDRPIIG